MMFSQLIWQFKKENLLKTDTYFCLSHILLWHNVQNIKFTILTIFFEARQTGFCFNYFTVSPLRQDELLSLSANSFQRKGTGMHVQSQEFSQEVPCGGLEQFILWSFVLDHNLADLFEEATAAVLD